MAGFWKRRFEPPATPSQRIFDVVFGIVAPILCLVFDPAIFRNGYPAGMGFLGEYRPFAYVAIAFSIIGLAYYLVRQRGALLLAGVFFGGGIFSLALGIAILPMTFIGLFIGIGVFGLTPFVTSFVFIRNGYRALRGSATRQESAAFVYVAIGLFLVIGVPLATHVFYMRTINYALTEIISGNDQEYAQGVHRLKLFRYEADQLALRFVKCDDDNQRTRLSRAYTDLTGEPIEALLNEIAD